MRPLAIDLFCGLGGWSEGLFAEGYEVVGFDIERHVYGEHRYPAQLVVQDVLTLHGSQFKDAALIVASPPCQEYSYMAMPWTRAKQIAAEYRDGTRDVAKLNALFDACFRIQREASEAAGQHIPLVVENVRGAIPWVGRSRWNFGSFHLWGDVPALMPDTINNRLKTELNDRIRLNDPARPFSVTPEGIRYHGAAKPFGTKQGGSGADWWDKTLDERRREATAIKNGGDWFSSGENCSAQRRAGSKSSSRKFASAMIAKIPPPLAQHIGWTFYPRHNL